jgi:hypothetical protein
LTPSEYLWALAAERANAPDHMRELFALVIDRAVSTEVTRINRRVGRTPRLNYADSSYERLLREYVGLKLHLHVVRKGICIYSDETACRKWYAAAVARCDDLKRQIKVKRANAQFAAWGDLNPTQK